MTRPTDHSLPGMGWALMTTTSPSSMREPLVVPGRHERQGRHRLALGAGRDDADLPVGEHVDLVDVDQDAVGDVRMPEAAGELDVLAHRAAEGGHLAAAGHGGVDDLLDAVDVAGEAGHHDPAPGPGHEDPAHGEPDRALRGREAGLLGVGRVGQEQPDPLGRGQGTDAGQVGPAAVDRLEVELEVARVQDHPLGGVEGDGEGVGHRVGDGDELDVAGTDPQPLAVGHRHEARPAGEARLVDPVAGQAEGELGAVDGELAGREARRPGLRCGPRGRG